MGLVDLHLALGAAEERAELARVRVCETPWVNKWPEWQWYNECARVARSLSDALWAANRERLRLPVRVRELEPNECPHSAQDWVIDARTGERRCDECDG